MYKLIGSDQKIYGPVSVAQIRQWQTEGRVNSATLAQAEGSNDWKPLSSLPEFGVPPLLTVPPPLAVVPRHNGMAVAGLTCGVLSNICCCFSLPFAILGIVFSVIALSKYETHPNTNGRTMALCGLVLSVVGVTWQVILPWLYGGTTPARWFWMHRHWRRL